jgi:hypothetical protein
VLVKWLDHARHRGRRWLVGLAVAAIVVPLGTLTPYALHGTEMVKLRNAALLAPGLGPDFDWAAPPTPPGFLVDNPPYDPIFAGLAQRLGLSALPNDWERALAISRHLLAAHDPLVGGGIQADLHTTYAGIVDAGAGYCADFIRAFMAVASAAELPIRAWAFSFDGFGGDGHIWLEIWDRQAARWRLLDLYNNYYYVEAGSDEPLSAKAMRERIARDDPGIAFRRIEPAARVGWIHEDKARSYYRKGLDGWYLFWGSNVLDVERSTSFRLLNPLSFRLAQVATVFEGVQPTIRPLLSETNRSQVEALQRLRTRMLIAVASALAGALLLVLIFVVPPRAPEDD